MKKRYYAAYGSNLNTQQMKARCPNARLVGTAELEGWRLLYRKSKTGFYATIEPANGCSVPIAVWEVTEEDETRMDWYEGVPYYYHKLELKADILGIKSGKYRRRRIFVYVLPQGAPIGVPTYRYMRTCIQGYRNFGFDCAILDEAYDYSEEKMKHERAAAYKMPVSQPVGKRSKERGDGILPRRL